MKRFNNVLFKIFAIVQLVQVRGIPQDIQESTKHYKFKPRIVRASGDVVLLKSEPLNLKIRNDKTNESIPNYIFPRSVSDIYKNHAASNVYYNMMAYLDSSIDRLGHYSEEGQQRKMSAIKQNSLLDDLPPIENISEQFKELKRVKREYADSEILYTTTVSHDGYVTHSTEKSLLYQDEDGFLSTVEKMIAMIDEQLKNRTEIILKRIARHNDLTSLAVTAKTANIIMSPTIEATHSKENTNEKGTRNSIEISSSGTILVNGLNNASTLEQNSSTGPSLLQVKRNVQLDQKIPTIKFNRYEMNGFNNTTNNSNETSKNQFELNNSSTVQLFNSDKTMRHHFELENMISDTDRFDSTLNLSVYETTTTNQFNSNETLAIKKLEFNQTINQFNFSKISTPSKLKINRTTNIKTNKPDQFIKSEYSNQSNLDRTINPITSMITSNQVQIDNKLPVVTQSNNANESNNRNDVHKSLTEINRTTNNDIELTKNTTPYQSNINKTLIMNHHEPNNLTSFVKFDFNTTVIPNITSNDIVSKSKDACNRTEESWFGIENVSSTSHNETDLGSADQSLPVECNHKSYEAKIRDREDAFDMQSENEDMYDNDESMDKWMKSIIHHPISFQPDDALQRNSPRVKLEMSSILTPVLNVVLLSLLVYGVYKLRVRLNQYPIFRRAPNPRPDNFPFVSIPLHAP